MRAECMMGIYFILGKLHLDRILLLSQIMSRHESLKKYIKVITYLMASIWANFVYFLISDGYLGPGFCLKNHGCHQCLWLNDHVTLTVIKGFPSFALSNSMSLHLWRAGVSPSISKNCTFSMSLLQKSP